MSAHPLPPTAQVIAEVIGRAATVALAGKCLYRHLSVPKRPMPPSHWIVRTIGRAKANALQSALGGELLPLATCHAVLLAKRDAAIRAARAAGESREAIAARFGLTTAHVWRILNPKAAQRDRELARERWRRAHKEGRV